MHALFIDDIVKYHQNNNVLNISLCVCVSVGLITLHILCVLCEWDGNLANNVNLLF